MNHLPGKKTACAPSLLEGTNEYASRSESAVKAMKDLKRGS
jgi:hypothetical protein